MTRLVTNEKKQWLRKTKFVSVFLFGSIHV